MRFTSLLKVSAVIILAAATLGCHRFTKKNEIETLPVDQLYSVAKTALDTGNMSKVVRYDQRLIARFPFGPYTEQAKLDLAYAQYKTKKREDAYSTINSFIKTYPAHKHVDYAYYLRGVINFDRDRGYLSRYANQDMTKRDQGNTLKSFEDFNALVARFPSSRYAADARQRMIYLRDNLAHAQVDIAKFYLRHGAYVAAANRARGIVEKYQRTPAAGDALAIMIISYKALNQAKLAANTERVLKLNYPNHPYLRGDWPKHSHWWMRMIPFRS